jgi:hypothetical protein
MRLFAISLFLLIAQTSFSIENDENWTCSVDGEPTDQTVGIALPGPTVDYFLKYINTEGETIERHENLISLKTVTSYKIIRKNCEEKISNSVSDLIYNYSTKCGSATASFQINKETGLGFYSQQMFSTGPARTIKFSSCKLVP